jgi:host factor-I protein
MESVSQTDDSSLNIQNDYFNKARKNHTRITVVLGNGQRISGFIRSFDKFTLILDTRNGDQMIFKHAISTVAPAHQGDREVRGPRPPRHHGGGRPPHQGRPGGEAPPPREGGPPREKGSFRQRAASAPSGKAFGNYMDLTSVSKGGGGKDAPAKADEGKPERAGSESGKPEDRPGPKPVSPATETAEAPKSATEGGEPGKGAPEKAESAKGAADGTENVKKEPPAGENGPKEAPPAAATPPEESKS